MGASLWQSQRSGYYQPGYGYSENEPGAYTNAWGQTVYTGGSGVYDANGRLQSGNVITSGGVVNVGGNGTKTKWRAGDKTRTTTTTNPAAQVNNGGRANLSAQSLYQIWKSGGQLTSEEIEKVKEYLTLLKLEQAASGSGGGGGGGSAREQYAGQSSAKNRYKKMTGGGAYDRMTGKTTY